MEYTKGEWRVFRPYMDEPIEIHAHKGTTSKAICRLYELTDAQLANAQLIASAPDLEKSCKDMLQFIRDFGNHRHLEEYPKNCEHCRIIREGEQALAKAEGK